MRYNEILLLNFLFIRSGDLITERDRLNRKYEVLKKECLTIKEESANRLTQINELSEKNAQLNEEIVELRLAKAVLNEKSTALQSKYDDLKTCHKEDDLKTSATMQQQIKLIDFLQNKLEESSKKKTFTDKLFGLTRKDNNVSKPSDDNTLKEQNNNGKSVTVISETDRNQPVEMDIEELCQSPASQQGNFKRKHSVQRMHHKIPHRFNTSLCRKPHNKCAACSEILPLGRYVSVCKYCAIVAHQKCTKKVSPICGLPSELTQLSLKTLTSSDLKSDVKDKKTWVKIPTKTGWTKKLIALNNTKLEFYDEEPSETSELTTPTFTLELLSEEGDVKLFSNVTSADCDIKTAKIDLAFIIKLDIGPDTTCWPQRAQLIMFLNSEEKEKWIVLLERFVSPGNNFELIVRLPNQEEVICLKELNDSTVLLGGEEGLYSVNNKQLVSITGIKDVQQIETLQPINTCLMICGDKQTLVKTELKQLESIAQRAQFTHPHVNVTEIKLNTEDGILIFRANNSPDKPVVCAASCKQLFILSYDFDSTDFVPVRVLDTAEPCSCILFNDQSVIVGANKYFEIDLKNFAANELLDVSDSRLSDTYHCYKMGSYPLEILLSSKDPKEYLLCFNEFGCFVDEYGRKSRESNLKWSHMPIAFAYCQPFLYIVQFGGVEIIRIEAEDESISTSSWIIPDSTRITLNMPRLLGSNTNGVYLRVDSQIVFLNGRKVVDGVDDNERVMQDSNAGEISSSSSEIIVLEDSGESGDSEEEKRVRFAL